MLHRAIPCSKKEVGILAVSPKNVRLAVTIDKDTAKKVEQTVEKKVRTFASMLAILIKEALQERNKK